MKSCFLGDVLIDWLAVTESVGIVGAIATWLVKRGAREAKVDARLKAEAERLTVHESGCEKRYKEIRDTFDELRESMTASLANGFERLESKLDRQDEESAQRNVEAVAHRTAITKRVEEIGTSVAVLEENKRMRERWEDRA